MNLTDWAGQGAEDFHPLTREFFAGRKIAVTGGSGFIGSHLVEQLVELRAQPIVITRQNSPRFLTDLRDRVEVRVCDLRDYESTVGAMRGASAVLHLAAVVGGIEFNQKHPASIFQSNLEIFFNSIRAASELSMTRFLVTSSACVYPRNCAIPTPESEGFASEPEPTNSGYGWAKRMEEFLGAKYATEYHLAIAIARPYNVYGPRDNFNTETSHVIPSLIVKAFRSQDGTFSVWGDGSHSRSFLYVEDAARGLLEVTARHANADALNIGGDSETTIEDTARSIAALVSEIRGVKIEPVFEVGGLTGQPRRRADTTKLKTALAFQPRVELKKGLERTVKWFHEHENRSLPAHT